VVEYKLVTAALSQPLPYRIVENGNAQEEFSYHLASGIHIRQIGC